MKYTLLSLATIFAILASNAVGAQDDPAFKTGNDARFGHISLGVVAPFGDLSDELEMGVVARMAYERSLGSKFAVGVGGGYIHFMDRRKERSVSQIPLHLNLRYYAMDRRRGLYAELQHGVHINTTRYDVSDIDMETEAWHAFAPQIGYYFTENFSFALKYQLLWAPKRDRMIIDSDVGKMIPVSLPKAEFFFLGADFVYTW